MGKEREKSNFYQVFGKSFLILPLVFHLKKKKINQIQNTNSNTGDELEKTRQF